MDEHKNEHGSVELAAKLDEARKELEFAESNERELESKVEELEDTIRFHKDSMQRVANAVGVGHICQLLELAESDQENYTDLLVKWIGKNVMERPK